NCTSLASVTVRSRELSMNKSYNGRWAFENAGTGAGGISATFASTCKAVPANFFNHTEGAPKVTSVAVQSGVAQIGNAAFQGCSYLASVDLPNSITLIGEYAFNNCTDLAALRIPPKVPADALGLKAYVDLSLGSKVTVTTGDQYNRLKGNDSYINTMRTTVELASNSLYRAKVAAVANQVYTGKKIVPSPAVKIGSKTLRKGADYTVSYSANKSCGQATITIKGKGGYVGTKAVTFKVVPAKVTGLKLGSSYRGHLSVSWSTKKALKAGASGYRVYWKAAGKKKGSYGFVAYPSYSSFSTYGLPAKKVSVKVQAYVTVDGKNAYGPWSAAKTVKVRG
ncbi:MAG: leucine-rich repeat protein, partial [Eggerthellaceae bacterium]|nr:leucine-rich repeat protein [Eggerthellaceae bacterium]